MRGDSLLWAWQVLDVPEGSGMEDCRRAYRKLILANHPDLQGRASPSDIRLSEERTKDLNRAWSIVTEYFRGGNETATRTAAPVVVPLTKRRLRKSGVWVLKASLLSFAFAAIPLGFWLVGARDHQRTSFLSLRSASAQEEHLQYGGRVADAVRPLPEPQSPLRQVQQSQAQDSSDTDALLDAAYKGDVDRVRGLVSAGVDPNRPNWAGVYALSMLAGVLNNSEREGSTPYLAAIEFLLLRGASPAALRSAMFNACNNAEVLGLLMNAGAPATAKNRDGNTVLHLSQAADVVDKLVARGADVNALNNEGLTPLDTAERRGAQWMVRPLLRFHAHRSPRPLDRIAKLRRAHEIGLVEFVGVNPRTGLPTHPRAIKAPLSVEKGHFAGTPDLGSLVH